MSILKVNEIQPQSGSDLDIKSNTTIGESGDPKALTVTGNLNTEGYIGVDGDLTVDTDVFHVDVTDDKVKVKGLMVINDEGTGEAGALTLTNVNDDTVDTGTGTILLKGTGTTGNSAGFIKAYIGTTVVYIPYFTDITGS